MSEHWSLNAQQWDLFTSPLRAEASDIEIFEAKVANIAKQHAPLNVVLLGLTPEIINMRWPAQSTVHAVEKNSDVVEQFWKIKPGFQLHLADWLQIPLAAGTVDVVIGDGCFTNLGSIQLYKNMFKEISRLLTPQGHFIHRYFVQSTEKENWLDVLSTPDANFHVYKWRLAMSLQKEFLAGVKLGDIWEKHQDLIEGHESWNKELEATINSYKGIKVNYSFPTLLELQEFTLPYFNQLDIQYGKYNLSERCPIVHYQANDK